MAWCLAITTVVLAAADAVTTEIMLSHYGGVEGNPIIAWLMAALGPWWMAPKLFANVAISLLLLANWRSLLARVAMWIYLALYALVVGRHIFLLVRTV